MSTSKNDDFPGNNLIQSVPIELAKMSSIQALDVSYNMLHELPQEFENKLKASGYSNDKKFSIVLEGNDIPSYKVRTFDFSLTFPSTRK